MLLGEYGKKRVREQCLLDGGILLGTLWVTSVVELTSLLGWLGASANFVVQLIIVVIVVTRLYKLRLLATDVKTDAKAKSKVESIEEVKNFIICRLANKDFVRLHKDVVEDSEKLKDKYVIYYPTTKIPLAIE